MVSAQCKRYKEQIQELAKSLESNHTLSNYISMFASLDIKQASAYLQLAALSIEKASVMHERDCEEDEPGPHEPEYEDPEEGG